jgi:hypothetical protein
MAMKAARGRETSAMYLQWAGSSLAHARDVRTKLGSLQLSPGARKDLEGWLTTWVADAMENVRKASL